MYSIIDIEGNGGSFRQESIIDIAIYKFNGHEIVDQFMSLVNPEAEITPYVQKLTRISPKMVKTAPKFHEIAKRIVEITEGTTLVGHNIDFDYRMLRQSFKRLGYDFKIDTIDTIPLAKKLIPEAESYSLGKLVKSVGIPLLDAHRAAGDAKATLDLFRLLINKDVDNEIIQEHFDQTNAKTYVNKIKELTQDLPNEKGIIYFQDKKGKILFTDFVLDINKCAKKVFNSKSKRWESLQKDCEQIHYDLAGNDIIAKLLMKTKGLYQPEKYPYGLYFKNDKYKVEKNSLQESKNAILKFKSFTQGKKALSFILSRSEVLDGSQLKQKLNLKNRNEIWTCGGRQRGEKAFITIENGKISSYGFYEYFNQIQTKEKIGMLQIPLTSVSSDIQNSLKLSLLKGDFEIHPFPKI